MEIKVVLQKTLKMQNKCLQKQLGSIYFSQFHLFVLFCLNSIFMSNEGSYNL